jgi:molybdopterin/thiamine biosynthesis adenylyltransferase
MENEPTIVVAGAGGAIGSHLVPHLARTPGLRRLTLVDFDRYDETNLWTQDIEASDFGQPKVRVQAAKVRRINPALTVETFAERLEDFPRGLLRATLLVSCLDSRAARQHVNEIAYRLSMPWIDCGVLGSENLARVNAYVPERDAPCLECSWSGEDYALLEQEYLCGGGNGAARPTRASSALAALAASLVAIEIAKLLAGDRANSVVGRQVVVNAQHHSLTVTAARRNPACLFDHQSWLIEPRRCRLASALVGETLDALGGLQVDGHKFVSALVCPACSHRQDSFRLNRPLARCPACARRMVDPGFGSCEHLDSNLPPEYRALTLAQAGLRHGDVISAGGWHYQLLEAA